MNNSYIQIKRDKHPIRYIFLIAYLATIYSVSLSAQVTIGSSIPPRHGALLDIKEKTVTTKGLGLPRVELKEYNKLIMGDKTIEDINNAYKNHTGLLVYNVAVTDICSEQPLYEGLYVWDGGEWQRLSRIPLTDGVFEDTDQDGNNFLYRKFGDAGYWMLENLRVTKYDPKRDGIDPTNITLTGPALNLTSSQTLALWSYPLPEGSNDPYNSTLYDAKPSIGFLYTWAAVSRGLPNNNIDEGGANEPPTKRQGICPSGWHLPSDKEWTLFENEMQTNTSKYSTDSDIGGIVAELGQASDADLAIPIISPCEPYDGWAKGTSKAKEMGGFAGLYAGLIQFAYPLNYGISSNFWTGSIYHYMTYVRIIGPGFFGSNNIDRSTHGHVDMFSVRCKKN